VYSISWLNFLKFVRFSFHVKNDVRLVTQECKHIQPQKRSLVGINHSLSVPVMPEVPDMPSKLSLPRQGP